jgi:hypothetical protein
VRSEIEGAGLEKIFDRLARVKHLRRVGNKCVKEEKRGTLKDSPAGDIHCLVNQARIFHLQDKKGIEGKWPLRPLDRLKC